MVRAGKRFNLEIVRDFDGTIIKSEALGLTATEVMARKTEEQCQPGTIVSFTVTNYIHGERLVREQYGAEVAQKAFGLLRRTYNEDLKRKDGK